VKVLILEVDGERRRLSLSLKRVEENGGTGEAPDLGLSEEVFTDAPAATAETYEAGEPAADDEPVGETEAPPADAPAEEDSAV
jgi:small subunit ribosomal protein S1